MGSKLESVKERVNEAKEGHQEAIELGQRDAEDIANVKSILEGIPSDVDLDSASDVANDASEEAQEQQGLSEQAASSFEQVSGSSEFGSSADGAADLAHQSAESFVEASDEAMESVEAAEAEFADQLAEIQS